MKEMQKIKKKNVYKKGKIADLDHNFNEIGKQIIKYKNMSFKMSFFFSAWITWVRDASHVTKRIKKRKKNAKCAARIIHGAQSGGGRQNIWDSLIPSRILSFFLISPFPFKLILQLR